MGNEFLKLIDYIQIKFVVWQSTSKMTNPAKFRTNRLVRNRINGFQKLHNSQSLYSWLRGGKARSYENLAVFEKLQFGAFLSNVLKYGMAANFDMLFHVINCN